MKRLIFSFLFLIFLIGQVYCQSLTVGVKGGPTVSGILYSKFSPPAGHKFGFHAGVGLLKSISAHVDLGTEFMYEQRGYSQQYIYTNPQGEVMGNLNVTYLFDYIALPFYVRFHTSKNIQLFLDLGLYPSYMVSARAISPRIDENGDLGPRKKYKMDPFPSELKRFDFGALIGGGVEFKIRANTILNLNLRYNNGLISAFDKLIYNQNMFLNSLNFSIGLNYKISDV